MSHDSEPAKKYEKFDLRLPLGMRKRVAEAAKASGRSMNAELVFYVATALNSAVTARSLKNIEDKLDRLLEAIEAGR